MRKKQAKVSGGEATVATITGSPTVAVMAMVEIMAVMAEVPEATSSHTNLAEILADMEDPAVVAASVEAPVVTSSLTMVASADGETMQVIKAQEEVAEVTEEE
jgi:PIN domain nuclease of toxin-antitoxin system